MLLVLTHTRASSSNTRFSKRLVPALSHLGIIDSKQLALGLGATVNTKITQKWANRESVVVNRLGKDTCSRQESFNKKAQHGLLPPQLVVCDHQHQQPRALIWGGGIRYVDSESNKD